ncbi:MAG: GNAT family N-acetyltransferase [Candidatus Sulfobium sp.]|jgi:ribosomal protein S18 acetylase RimI-like enzyme
MTEEVKIVCCSTRILAHKNALTSSEKDWKEILIRLEHKLPTVSEYTYLRDSVGWLKIDEQAAEIALSNSLFSVVALENNEIVGLGRIVGDGGIYYYIQDLIVHPRLQRQSIGKKLMDELMTYINANAKTGAFVGLMAAKGLERYYESFGFKARNQDAPGMYQVIE